MLAVRDGLYSGHGALLLLMLSSERYIYGRDLATESTCTCSWTLAANPVAIGGLKCVFKMVPGLRGEPTPVGISSRSEGRVGPGPFTNGVGNGTTGNRPFQSLRVRL